MGGHYRFISLQHSTSGQISSFNKEHEYDKNIQCKLRNKSLDVFLIYTIARQEYKLKQFINTRSTDILNLYILVKSDWIINLGLQLMKTPATCPGKLGCPEVGSPGLCFRRLLAALQRTRAPHIATSTYQTYCKNIRAHH